MWSVTLGIQRARESDPKSVVLAEEAYSRSLLSILRRATVLAVCISGFQALLWALSLFESDARVLTIGPAVLGEEHAAAALLLLVPTSIALQVLLRLPRDSEAMEIEDALARRQFWGRVSEIVVIASAFVAVSALVQALLAGVEAEAFDFARLFGLPFGALATALLAADAATVALNEAERLRLGEERRVHAIERLEAAVGSVTGRERRRPLRATIVQGAATTAATLAVCAAVLWPLVGHVGAIVAYIVIGALLAALCVGMASGVVTAMVQGSASEAVLLASMPALVALSLGLEGFMVALNVGVGVGWNRYIAAVIYGLLITAPACLAVAVVSVSRGTRRRIAPLLAVARCRLDAQIQRLRNGESRASEKRLWRTFAWAAIGLFLLPLTAIACAAIAVWHKNRSDTETDDRRDHRLLVWAWAIPIGVLALQVAAVLLLPVYGPQWK